MTDQLVKMVDPKHKATEKDVGEVVAAWCEWKSVPILLVFEAALTDANYHDIATVVRGIRVQQEMMDE